MVFFDQELFEGLTKVPTPTLPSVLVVTGNAQAILTGENPGDCILAGAKLDLGKIFVAGHSCYNSWLNETETDVQKDFINNLKLWLANGQFVNENDIADLNDDLIAENNFSKYKIIKLDGYLNFEENVENNLLEFIRNGGGLACACTVWGYLQDPEKSLEKMSLFNFLKKNTGILLTGQYSWFGQEIDISKNQVKRAKIDVAIQKITENPEKIDKYFNTLDTGLVFLKEEGLVTDEQLIQMKNSLIEKNPDINLVPTEENPISEKRQKNITNLIGKCLTCIDDPIKAPGIEKFPGDFTELPELIEAVQLKLSTKFHEWLSTGYYLAAGVNLSLSIESGNIHGWNVRIGVHVDDLSKADSYRRWPIVSYIKKLDEEQMTFNSPYGGLIFFESPKEGGEIFVKLSNVIESPFIDLTIPETISDWNRRRYSPGLWAELAGNYVIFTTPSDCIRHIEDVSDVIKYWDEVIKTHHKLRGTVVTDYRRERIINDIQPSCGYMHSGYPIVTHLDCCQDTDENCIFDINKMKTKGAWGLFHEIGHNLQRNEWTFDGSREVTVNLFSMHAFQVILGEDVTKQEWLLNQIEYIKAYFSNPSPHYDDWQSDNGVALITFAMLIKHFGWEPMYTFLKQYEEDINSQSSNLPKNNQDKLNQWVLRYSKIISKNIKPHFEMFGLPVSDFVDQELNDLEPWCSYEEKDPNVFFDISC